MILCQHMMRSVILVRFNIVLDLLERRNEMTPIIPAFFGFTIAVIQYMAKCLGIQIEQRVNGLIKKG